MQNAAMEDVLVVQATWATVIMTVGPLEQVNCAR